MANDIAQWLEGLGLGQYWQTFAENDIDLDILAELTDADLKELGVSLGDRRRLLKAIAAESTRFDAQEEAPQQTATLRPPGADAERRQLTVMFCDLVGSTALSTKLDPEDMREVLRAYQETVSSIVERYGGHIAKFLGDGVLAYFGWPNAHEDDAERGVRAGLESVAEVGKLALDGEILLQARAGIASGLVVAGDLVSESVTERGAVSGDTPNLAARLQEIAEPGTVTIGEATHRLAGAMFDCRDLEARQLKGFEKAVKAWTVVRPRRAESRFDATRARQLTEIIGREEETEILLRRWQRTKLGDGQIVLISGEPGIGKSRLVRSLADRIEEEPHTPIRLQCSPFHTSSSLYPYIEHLERAAGFVPNDTANTKLDKLEALLAQSGPTEDDAFLFAELLSISNGGRYSARALTPQHQKELTFAAIVNRLVRLSEEQPLMFVLEDAHWIDPTTLELLDLFLERVPESSVAVLITYRPEFTAPWIGRPRVTVISLGRLDRRDCAAMVERVAQSASLPAELRERIIAQTDGVPLFVEELTRSVMEAGNAQAALAVPATLQDSLEARLDRLGPAKELAQIGAVIGREFSYHLIASVASMPPDKLTEALNRLFDGDLVLRRGEEPEAIYTFKHALIQDTAYESLLRSRRRDLHHRVAQATERILPEAARAHPELLAQHYALADRPKEAVPHWISAGQKALERSANTEAVAHARHGLEVLERCDHGTERDHAEVELLTVLGSANVVIHGYNSPETTEPYERASVVAADLDAPLLQARPIFGLCLTHSVRGEYARALDRASQLLELAEKAGSLELQLQAHRLRCSQLCFQGDFPTSLTEARAGLALYDEERDRLHAIRYGSEPGSACLSFGGAALLQLGFVNQFADWSVRAVDLADRMEHSFSWWLACQLRLVGLVLLQETQLVIDEGKRLVSDPRCPDWNTYPQALLNWGKVAEGDLGAIDGIESAIAGLEKIGYGIMSTVTVACLADAKLRAGQYDAATAHLDEALTIADRQGENFCFPELHRIRGDVTVAANPSDFVEAEKHYGDAIDAGRRQSAKFMELRAAIRLAGLWYSQGNATDARDLLAPIYGWFTEGFDTSDLKEAKALLEELS